MPSSKTTDFVEVASPVTKPVTKFGGQPVWLQSPEWPFGPRSRLLLQLECSTYPFKLNLRTGVGYVFVDGDARHAALLWQC